MKPLSTATHAMLAVIALLMCSVFRASAEKAHLLPVGPDFDVEEPIGRVYSEVCERMLFGKRDWLIRYHTATESVTTGLSITKDSHGRCHVWARQAQPQLGSVVVHAFSRKANLTSALASVKIKRADAEIPLGVALAVSKLWLSLLSNVRQDERLTRNYVLSNQVILYAKTEDRKTVGGKFPPAGFKYENLAVVEDIIDDLISVCFARQKDRAVLFKKIEQRTLE